MAAIDDAHLLVTEVEVTGADATEEQVEKAGGHAGLALDGGVEAGLAVTGLLRSGHYVSCC